MGSLFVGSDVLWRACLRMGRLYEGLGCMWAACMNGGDCGWSMGDGWRSEDADCLDGVLGVIVELMIRRYMR